MPEIYQAKEKTQVHTSREREMEQSATKEEKAKNANNHPLASFHYRPRRVRFETQEREEKIVFLLRRHPITNLTWILTAVFLALFPLGLHWFPFLSFFPTNLQIAAFILWYLLVTAVVLEGALSWFFNVYIVTDERLIDVDFYNLIYRQITDAKIDKIQDVTYKVGGVLGTMFDYGDILIQTAGAIPNLEFEAIPHPAEVARVLQELRTEEEIEALEGRVR